MDKICKYCAFFYHSTIFRGEKIIQRRCKITKKRIQSNSKICPEFELNSLFYCEQNNEWVKIEVCKNRRKNPMKWNKRIGCKKCRQFFKEIIFHYPCYNSVRKLKRR